MKLATTLQSLLIASALLGAACQKEPSTSSLNNEYLVYTNYDQTADFALVDTYFLPDSILLIGNFGKAQYWKDERAQQILADVAAGLNADGYVQVTDKELADVGIQLSYVQQVSYYVGYDYPYWWWYYPYYWDPGYWGAWGAWHYPYTVQYGYIAGSLLIEMVNLEAPQAADKPLPVIWDSYIGGLLTSSETVNMERAQQAVKQAFDQSPYLNKSAR